MIRGKYDDVIQENLGQNIFIQELLVEITSDSIVDVSFLIFGFSFGLIFENSIFIPSIQLIRSKSQVPLLQRVSRTIQERISLH
jgi:hypothetical protein